MFGRAFRSKYRACYETCRYRDRIDLLASQLSILKYAEQRICVHVREWLRFTKHCADASIDLPSGICAPEVEDYLRQRSPRAGHHRRFVRTALRIFIEADHQGNFPRHIRAQPKPSTEIFTKWVIPYLRFLREHRGLAEATLRLNDFSLREFTKFAEKSGIHDLSSLNVHHIHDFCSNPGSYKPTTWALYMSNVRCFLRYMFGQQGLQCDLSLAVGGAKHFRHARLPDVLTESELNKILGCIDRSGPLGMRDYAVLLLAARYGIRPSDILRLRLDDIHWRERSLIFHQSKTSKPITLPWHRLSIVDTKGSVMPPLVSYSTASHMPLV